MASNKFSRRDFLKYSGMSAAFAASLTSIGGKLMALPTLQDAVNITFGGWGAVAEDEGVRAAIEVFQQENPGITVEWQHTPDAGQYTNTVLPTNIAAGTAPDTSFINADSYETYRAQGILMDLTDRIQADPLLGQPDYFLPQEADRCADDSGRWHGIGSCWVAHHIYYNEALFDEMGLPKPGFNDDEILDWDTFVDVAKQLTIDSAGRHPDDAGFDPDDIQRWGVDWPIWWMPIAAAVHSNGGSFFADGKVAIDTPEAMEAIQRIADLIYVHHVAPRTASMSDLGMSNTQMIDNNRLGMAVDGSWALSWMNPSLSQVPLNTGALPKMVQPATMMQAHFHSVLANSDSPDAAWEWVRFLSTPFYQTQFLKIGLWLPSQTGLSTEEGLATWITEGIHPANYSTFVSSYLQNHGVSTRLPAGYVDAQANFLTPAFDAIAAGTPVADVIPDAVRQANDVIAMAQL